MSKKSKHPAEAALRTFALSLPGTTEEFPWGDCAFKVNKKVFLFMGSDGDDFGTSTKLPHSHGMAMTLPFAEPTGYGLGKAGWVSARFKKGAKVPVDLLKEWIKESYLAIAPAKIAAALGGRSESPQQAEAKRVKAPKRAPAKKRAVKK